MSDDRVFWTQVYRGLQMVCAAIKEHKMEPEKKIKLETPIHIRVDMADMLEAQERLQQYASNNTPGQ